MTDYLLDTNHAALLMADGSLYESWSRRYQEADARLGISVTVMAELYYAAYASQHRVRNLERLLQLANRVLIWSFDTLAAEEFGRIQAEQKAKGRPIPAMDAQIAAVARLHKLTLVTADRHFQFVANLKIENWL